MSWPFSSLMVGQTSWTHCSRFYRQQCLTFIYNFHIKGHLTRVIKMKKEGKKRERERAEADAIHIENMHTWLLQMLPLARKASNNCWRILMIRSAIAFNSRVHSWYKFLQELSDLFCRTITKPNFWTSTGLLYEQKQIPFYCLKTNVPDGWYITCLWGL